MPRPTSRETLSSWMPRIAAASAPLIPSVGTPSSMRTSLGIRTDPHHDPSPDWGKRLLASQIQPGAHETRRVPPPARVDRLVGEDLDGDRRLHPHDRCPLPCAP